MKKFPLGRLNFYRLGFLFVLLTLASGCTTILKNPNFEKRSREFQTFSVVPPDVEIRLVVFTGDDKILYEEGKAASKAAVWAVTQEFEKRGYEVKPLELTPEILLNDPELGPALNRLKERYASVAEDIHEHHAGVFGDKVLKLTLGEEVNRFADLAGADALIFAKAIGIKKSGSEMAKEWVKSALIAGATFGSLVVIPRNAASHIDISVVDADTGEILWHNYSPQDKAYNLTENEDVVGMVGKVVKKYPKRVAKKPKVEVPEEAEKLVEGKPTRVIVPVEAAKLTAKTGVMAGEAAVDVTQAVLKGAATATTAASKEVVHLLTLGATRTQKGQADQAIRLYERAITLERENPYSYILLGDAYLRKGDLEKAEQSLKRAVEINPSIPESQRLLAEVVSQKAKP